MLNHKTLTDILLPAAGLAVLLTGCGDPILETTWHSVDDVGGETNALVVDSDLFADLQLFAFTRIDGDPVLFRWSFEGDVEVVSDGRYRSDLDASQFCSPDGEVCISENLHDSDTTLKCDMNGREDELDCELKGGGWENYKILEFERMNR